MSPIKEKKYYYGFNVWLYKKKNAKENYINYFVILLNEKKGKSKLKEDKYYFAHFCVCMFIDEENKKGKKKKKKC